MFERFTSEARTVVIAARGHAARLGHAWVGTEHLLRALVDGDGPAPSTLAAAGIGPSQVEAGIADAHEQAREADRRALASIGIDLDHVLDTAGLHPDVPTSRCRTRRWRRARPASPVFSPRAKKALELALREALRLADRTIGPEHLLLGVLREGDGLACRILVDQGVSIVALRRQLEAGRRRAG